MRQPTLLFLKENLFAIVHGSMAFEDRVLGFADFLEMIGRRFVSSQL